MSKDPFWIKKVLDRELIHSTRNFPALQQKTELETSGNNKLSERKKISEKLLVFPKNIRFNDYLRNQSACSLLSFQLVYWVDPIYSCRIDFP